LKLLRIYYSMVGMSTSCWKNALTSTCSDHSSL